MHDKINKVKTIVIKWNKRNKLKIKQYLNDGNLEITTEVVEKLQMKA